MRRPIWLGGGRPDSGGIRGLAGHWDGHAWHVDTLPAVQTLGDDVLNHLTTDGHHGLWAIGDCDCGGPAWRLSGITPAGDGPDRRCPPSAGRWA
jgi:hypothetical protein